MGIGWPTLQPTFESLTKELGHKMSVPPTEAQKLASNQTAGNENDVGVRLVTEHMSHSVDTARRYYQHLGVSHCSLGPVKDLGLGWSYKELEFGLG